MVVHLKKAHLTDLETDSWRKKESRWHQTRGACFCWGDGGLA